MKNTDLLKAREAVKLHTQKKSPLVTKSIAEVLDNEKACKKKAEICAKELEKVFKKMKKENPGKESYNVYNNEEGRKLIKDFLKMENEKITKAQLFDYLRVKLNNLGFISHRPWYGYFTDDPFDFGTAWYEISEKRNNNTQNNIA